MINKDYFKNTNIFFKKIQKDTLDYINVFEKYFEKNDKPSYTFEDFMNTLYMHLIKLGYSNRKIIKWFSIINNNVKQMISNIKKE